MKLIFSTALMVFFTAAMAQTGDVFRVYFLGGQSNMEGFGMVKDLPVDLSKPMKDVYIFHGNPAGDGDASGGLGKWETLRPGHGTGFGSDGKTNKPSDRFGVEMAFAQKMRALYPNEKIAIVKYARNGSSIDSLAAADFGCWEPDFNAKANQYDHFLKTLDAALHERDLNGDGKPDVLVPAGILWMQGEADSAFSEEIAQRYYANLKRLMDLIRAALHTDDLPVVLGKISDSGNSPDGRVWKYGELVQYAQEKFAKLDKRAAIVRSTSKYSYSDTFHYDSAGYLDFGNRFAEAMQQLRNR